MDEFNGTEINFHCMYIPFCDARDCDRELYDSPVDCPDCNRGMVALHFTILILMAIFITMGNLGIILVIKRNKIFHNSFNMFKCSLAFADLLVGVLVVPSGAYETASIMMRSFDPTALNRTDYLIGKDVAMIRPDSMCDRIYQEDIGGPGMFLSMISVLSVMASIFHLVLLSIDRFLAVWCPIKYNQRKALKDKCAISMIIFVWLVSITLSVVIPMSLGQRHFIHGLSPAMIFTLKTSNPSTGIFYATFGLGLPYLALLGLNTATGSIILIKHRNLVRRSSLSPSLNSGGRRKDEVKATITILVMIVVFTLSTLPAMVAVTFYNGTEHKKKGDATIRSIIYSTLILLLVSNSAWNFIIYSWRNDNFRKALKNLFTRKQQRQRAIIRWKQLKCSVLLLSEEKRRRKKLIKLTEASNSYSSEKM